MVVIIDSGIGNTGSILNMLRKIGAKAVISSEPEQIKAADKLIMPGIGAFDNGIKMLEKNGLIPLLERKVIKDKTPILGICLGMQLFTKKSEEGVLDGLGWVDAVTKKFRNTVNENKIRIPHMGWNIVEPAGESWLFADMDQEKRFYFSHSYYVICNNNNNITATTLYGHNFVSILQKDNIIGVQFHPEKSHIFGMKLLKNFLTLP
jgi:glutamine amidotransferase